MFGQQTLLGKVRVAMAAPLKMLVKEGEVALQCKGCITAACAQHL